MKFKNSTLSKALTLVGALLATIACEKDFNTIGTGIIGNENFRPGDTAINVFAYNRRLKAYRADNLPIYKLGDYTHPVYGKTSASIVTQLSLAVQNPNFGSFSQTTENGAATDDNEFTVAENETVTKVYLDIPFFSNVLGDSDGDGALDDIDPNPRSRDADEDNDGVIEPLDTDDADPQTDYDGDGVADEDESTNGTSPYLPDTDFDGIPDGEDDDQDLANAPQRYEIDSVFGNKLATMNFKVSLLTFYLTELNPNPNAPFSQVPEYFTTFNYNAFASNTLFEQSDFQINTDEILLFENEDNEDTEDVDESQNVSGRLSPRIRVELDKDFFQQSIINQEGSDNLASQPNFQNFLRGLLIEADVPSEDLLMLFNLTGANVQIRYNYQRIRNTGTTDDPVYEQYTDSTSFNLNLGGGINKAVNLVNEEIPSGITSQINEQNASRLFLKGGQGIFTEIALFDEESDGETLQALRLKAKKWLINEANLVFYIDDEQLNANGAVQPPDRVYLYNLTDNLPLSDYVADVLFGGTGGLVYDGQLQKNSSGTGIKYKIRITDHVNRVLKSDSTNVRLGLALTSNIQISNNLTGILNNDEEVKVPLANAVNPLGTILFGNNVEAAFADKKLMLEIYFSELKEGEFIEED